MKPTEACPCGSKQTYANCCGPFHEGSQKPDTAEKLMRSRYSAYVVGKIDYVGNTNDPKEKESFDHEAAKEWSQSSKWLGLEILATRAGLAGDETGEVEFKAHYEREGKEYVHHEISLFHKIASKWYYIEGKEMRQPERRLEPKVGRNDPCTCGSGKKYKKCCAA